MLTCDLQRLSISAEPNPSRIPAIGAVGLHAPLCAVAPGAGRCASSIPQCVFSLRRTSGWPFAYPGANVQAVLLGGYAVT